MKIIFWPNSEISSIIVCLHSSTINATHFSFLSGAGSEGLGRTQHHKTKPKNVQTPAHALRKRQKCLVKR